ncbi:glycosyltransferase [Anaeroselena agilis]|uniref:Glycosyltransferase n=1 Tax=Anaeroselena agilis TaxID=3063788 RepID=A0ABU3NSC4_9FIRM|nr:glycosyltransferase [Selenomonadales bacterium 4137-cl]
MKTSIIIWNYNQPDYTRQCLDNIRSHTPPGAYELLVIDDNSADGAADWLRAQADVTVIATDRHLGYPAGCNQGIRAASGDNILLLDNDVTVFPGWLENLLSCLYGSEEIGAAGPVTDNRGAPGRPAAAGWEARLKLAGHCLLVKRSVVDSIGLLDEAFTPGYFVDDDYSFRILMAGYKLALCKSVLIHHAGAAHFRQDPDLPEQWGKNRAAFNAKWGFDPYYSTGTRWDIIGLIDKSPQDEFKVLEVGCACGATLLQIKNLFPHASLFGVELNEQAAAIARSFAEVIAADLETAVLPYPAGSFDCVILADILEHLLDPWRALASLKQYLKPDGQILASIPNVMHFSVLRSLLTGNWTYEDAGILDRTHLRFFTLSEIKKMFASAGYAINAYHPTVVHETDDDRRLIDTLAGYWGDDRLASEYRAYQYIIKAGHAAAALPAVRPSQALREDKICFITYVNDAAVYRKCLDHIKGLDVPDDLEVEILALENNSSMAGAYNQAIVMSDAKYKVYLHQDVFIVNKRFIADVLKVFAEPEVGMIGVAGCRLIPANGIWWESPAKFGKVYDSHAGAMGLLAFGEVTADFQEVQGIDGLIMVTQYDLPWRADIFTGWHFYDLSQSMEFIRAAYKVVVPRQRQPWCIHDSGPVVLGKEFGDYRQVFVHEYLGVQNSGGDK